MARSPFQGTWQDGVRPTVVTAPDAIVYLNGSPDVLGCNSCKKRFDLNRYVTSIQVDLNVESAPGSASISLSIPRHTVDDFFVDGEPIVLPMMEVEIYAKGYFLVEGVPQYYPIFWGLVTEVSDNYGNGEHTVSINCADILKWWDLCKMNVNPAFTQASGSLGRDYINGTFFNANVYDVIWTLAQQSFGDVIQATGSLVASFREAGASVSGEMLRNAAQYWTERFSQMRSNLLLYGVEGAAVRGDLLYDSQSSREGGVRSKFASKAVRAAHGGQDTSQLFFNPDTVVPFRSQLSQAGQPNLWQSEYQSKLEIANVCKEAVGFEFFMDVTGDIVFKPPFYNLDVLSNKPVSWIQDIDIINWTFSESEAEVVTHLQMQGSFEGGAMDTGVTSDVCTPYTQVIDFHLLGRYGWRTQTYNSEYLNNTQSMFYMGLDILDRYNSKRHRGSVTIPFRPELRLGFPVYVAPKDQVWYLMGISHNITMGGQAQTTLTLSARRQKFVAPRGIGTLELSGFKSSATDKKKAATGVKGGQTVETESPTTKKTVPTGRQLSQTGHFKMTVGTPAQVPAPPRDPTSVAPDPYEPLIMRHPKTGRIVGYPNVVLAYTKAYRPTRDEMARMAGQRTSGRGTAAKIREKTDDGTARSDGIAILEETLTQTSDRDLIDKHMTGRYMYGMTSAGVYTYVHDTSQVIQELTQLPAKNIEVADRPSSDLFGTTASIRPVSDERGFELIGHYRYGRGVALRDGSLVLSDGGGANQKAAVETQIALSGGLIESLQAQSAGLTSITSAYVNPADAVSRLQPEDLQSAGTVNPETGLLEFQSASPNFVASAPLNSPENAGLPTNVEASQLSRALTLAELAPFMDESLPEETCQCSFGRADLAFINVGYQVDFLGSAATDDSNLTTVSGGTGSFGAGQSTDSNAEVTEIDARLAEIDARLAEQTQLRDALRAGTPTTEDTTLQTLRAELTSQQNELAHVTLDIADAQTTLDTALIDPTLGPDDPETAVLRQDLSRLESRKAELETGIAETESSIENRRDELAKEGSTGEGYTKIITEIESLESEKAALEARKAEPATLISSIDSAGPIIDADGTATRPIMGGGIPTVSRRQTINRVEQFLANLYEVLDAPHQEYEQALRGALIPGPTRREIVEGTYQEDPRYGEFKPPFSPISRARGGDLDALARQGSTAIKDIGRSWQKFGERLQREPRKTELSARISQLDAKIHALNVEEQRLENALEGGSTIIADSGASIAEQLESLRAERSQAKQELAKAEADLQVIHNDEIQS